jgi:hypothetical protein
MLIFPDDDVSEIDPVDVIAPLISPTAVPVRLAAVDSEFRLSVPPAVKPIFDDIIRAEPNEMAPPAVAVRVLAVTLLRLRSPPAFSVKFEPVIELLKTIGPLDVVNVIDPFEEIELVFKSMPPLAVSVIDNPPKPVLFALREVSARESVMENPPALLLLWFIVIDGVETGRFVAFCETFRTTLEAAMAPAAATFAPVKVTLPPAEMPATPLTSMVPASAPAWKEPLAIPEAYTCMAVEGATLATDDISTAAPAAPSAEFEMTAPMVTLLPIRFEDPAEPPALLVVTVPKLTEPSLTEPAVATAITLPPLALPLVFNVELPKLIEPPFTFEPVRVNAWLLVDVKFCPAIRVTFPPLPAAFEVSIARALLEAILLAARINRFCP